MFEILARLERVTNLDTKLTQIAESRAEPDFNQFFADLFGSDSDESDEQTYFIIDQQMAIPRIIENIEGGRSFKQASHLKKTKKENTEPKVISKIPIIVRKDEFERRNNAHNQKNILLQNDGVTTCVNSSEEDSEDESSENNDGNLKRTTCFPSDESSSSESDESMNSSEYERSEQILKALMNRNMFESSSSSSESDEEDDGTIVLSLGETKEILEEKSSEEKESNTSCHEKRTSEESEEAVLLNNEPEPEVKISLKKTKISPDSKKIASDKNVVEIEITKEEEKKSSKENHQEIKEVKKVEVDEILLELTEEKSKELEPKKVKTKTIGGKKTKETKLEKPNESEKTAIKTSGDHADVGFSGGVLTKLKGILNLLKEKIVN